MANIRLLIKLKLKMQNQLYNIFAIGKLNKKIYNEKD